ncbi:hypothetical protein SEA_WHITNEY_92 [Gordonia phage Whitney]|nr:hypothetical protein SEA_WHITNEY_92 [Gordonia phage Whitney]
MGYEYRVVPRDSLGRSLWAIERQYMWRNGRGYGWDEWMVFRSRERAEETCADLRDREAL